MDCSGDRACVNAATGLPMRVLMRPAARLFAEPDRGAPVVAGNLRAFRPWFMFETRGLSLSPDGRAEGWYQVGLDPERAQGWVLAEDAIPWTSALVVTYTHPRLGRNQRRSPVLMFDSIESLHDLVAADDPEAFATSLIADVAAGDAAAFRKKGLVSIEPRRFADFRQGFYILPVLDYARLPLFDGEARLLKLAAAVPQTQDDLGRGAPRLDDPAFRQNALAADTVDGTAAAKLAVEIKFVVDMTASMQPQIDAAARAIEQLAGLLERERRDVEFRYGLVGYTDVAEQCARCPFTIAHDFFPQQSVGADALVETLRRHPKARANGGGDWRESLFEGVAAAIESRWSENALRFVVQIGDASSNPFGGPKNDGFSAESVRALADAADVRIIALHALVRSRPGAANPEENAPPAAAEAAESVEPPWFDGPLAERQLTRLAANPGQSAPSYLAIDVDPNAAAATRAAYYDAIYGVAQSLAAQMEAVRAGRLGAEPGPAARRDLRTRAGAVAEEAFAAALISYLGAPATRPRDLTFWALDVDPVDFATPALEVRVLLEKRDLETLIRTLEGVLEAFLVSRSINSETFFTELQAASTALSFDAEAGYGAIRSLAGSGALPRWLQAMPYRSQIMSLTPERFAEMSADERDRLEQSIVKKLYTFRDLYNSDVWIALWPGADEFDRVYPIPLGDLP